MPVLNFDGSEYKLETYNPIMAAQTIHNEYGILHNMEYTEYTYSPTKNSRPIYEKKIESPVETKIEEPLIEPEPIIEQEQVISPEPVPNQPKSKPSIPNRILCHVLPVISEEKIIYGENFTSEIIRMGGFEDLISKFWTNAFPPLLRGSILFIPEDLRWWKVQKCIVYNGGITIECTVSDLTPSFK